MKSEEFVHRSRIPAPPAEVFRWHARPGALERLNPPWDPVEVVERRGSGIEAGTEVVLRMRLGPFHRQWVARHDDCVEGRRFKDVQLEGPFARWEHTHIFESDGGGGASSRTGSATRCRAAASAAGSAAAWCGTGSRTSSATGTASPQRISPCIGPRGRRARST